MNMNIESVQASDDRPPAQRKARVAKIAICHDRACSILSSTHLSIEMLEAPLDHGQATAISYTWGEFNRTEVPIGHFSTNGSNTISVELGEEWNVSEFIHSLASISSQGPIWLDQLCIPQKDEAIRQALASVPTIYRTFDVVVLMPGRPCRCLGDFLADADSISVRAGELLMPDVATEFEKRITKYVRCLNFTAPSSWFNRLWPRQELMYSQRICCIWTSQNAPSCVLNSRGEEAVHLSPYLAAMRTRLLNQGHTKLQADFQLSSHARTGQWQGVHEFMEYTRRVSPVDLFRFLGGETLQKGKLDAKIEPLARFILGFKHMTNSTSLASTMEKARVASQTRDYVLSVWVDCPQYVVPSNFKTLSLAGLMQDAVDQLATKHGLHFVTTAPQGLCDASNVPSACWVPKHYFPSVEVNSLKDVYGPVFTEQSPAAPLFTFRSLGGSVQCIPIELISNTTGSLAIRAMQYEEWQQQVLKGCSEEKAPRVLITSLKTLLARWTSAARENIRDFLATSIAAIGHAVRSRRSRGLPTSPPQNTQRLILMDELLDDIPQSPLFADFGLGVPRYEDLQWNASEIYSVLYWMMGLAMRAEPEFFWNNGVRIMVSGVNLDDMRLGFYRGDIDISSVRTMAEIDEVKSVEMNPATQVQHQYRPRGILIYEAVRVGEQPIRVDTAIGTAIRSFPTFKVFGLWVPLADRADEECNAEIIPNALGDTREMSRLSALLI